MRRAAILFLAVTITAIIAPRPQVAALSPTLADDYSTYTFVPVIVEPFLPTMTPTIAPRPEVAEPTPIVVPVATPRPKAYGPTVAAAKAYALDRLGAAQYACLDAIATRESHWNPTDLNSRSGAYGIPQAVPGSKMGSVASDWRTNPVTQVKWMIGYVDGRYGSACAAWSFWQGHGWY